MFWQSKQKRFNCGTNKALLCICCVECWTHYYASHILKCEIWISWGMWDSKPRTLGRDRQRGPCSRVLERGSSLVWISLVLSLRLHSTIFVPLLLCFHSGLLNKQEAKSSRWKCKFFLLSVLMFFHHTDRDHNKLDKLWFMILKII